MSPHNLHHEDDGWSRGQIFRTTIIFIEIVVLFAVVILASMPASVPQTADVAPMPELINVETNVDNDIHIPTTVYVDTSYRVFVIQNNRFNQIADLAKCNNRYIDAEFDGELYNYRLAHVDYLRHAVHAVTFMATDYDVTVNDDSTRVDIALDNGTVYTITLNCDYDYDAYRQKLDDKDDDSPSTLEELAAEADRQGFGCPNGTGH